MSTESYYYYKRMQNSYTKEGNTYIYMSTLHRFSSLDWSL